MKVISIKEFGKACTEHEKKYKRPHQNNDYDSEHIDKNIERFFCHLHGFSRYVRVDDE